MIFFESYAFNSPSKSILQKSQLSAQSTVITAYDLFFIISNYM